MTKSLAETIAGIAEAADIHVGVAVWHIESGQQVDVNGDAPFPMASTFKIPILATACRQLVGGELRLDTRIAMSDDDKSLGSGILPYFESGLQPTVRDLLTLMIIISDNTATDMMVAALGGAAAIEGYMQEIGLSEIYFKHNCKELLRYLFPDEVLDLPLEELIAWSAKHDIMRDGLAFSKGPENNVCTAKAMNKLLHMIYGGELFDGDARKIAIDILLKQQFNVRLSRFLPLGVKVAHKTGTIGGIRNDSGIIKISDKNHVILTIFSEWDERPFWDKPAAHHQRVFEVESAMGEIGLAAYEAFLRRD
ncbi:MAG: class A beta-lactamase-related serine hydrolase [Chloroflexi bacterium]|nr:class A beta-lactamase-related serine hydrolase [Chloroflexota bacterium]